MAKRDTPPAGRGDAPVRQANSATRSGGPRKPRGTNKAVRKARPYEMIRQAIRTGEFLPNQPLTEAALADWCGVSRTPIREALTRLQHEGLVARTEYGPVVRSRSLEEIFNIYEVRIVLEVSAARSAALRRTDRDLYVLRAALEQYERAELKPHPAVVASALDFHQAIWKAARNDTLFEMLMQLDMQVPRHPNEAMSDAELRERTRAHHRNLLEAIEAGDADRAAVAATEHYTEARDIRMKNWTSAAFSADAADQASPAPPPARAAD